MTPTTALLLVWMVIAALSTYATRSHLHLMDQIGRPASARRAVVIVPVKGASEATGRFFDALFAQTHPRFRIIAAVEAESEPALALARSAAAARPDIRLDCVVAGLAVETGQKVWNQLAALERLEADDELVVFVDADTVPAPHWLANLDWAVFDQGQEIVTGHRVIVPQPGALTTMIAASINLSAAVGPRVTGLTAAWGGTMAMSRATLDRLDLSRWWRGTLSDDLQLTASAKQAGILIHTSRATLLPTPWQGSFRDLASFAIRQFQIFRLYAPALFFPLLLLLAMPIAAGLAALHDAWQGGVTGYAAIGMALLFGAVRGRDRLTVMRRATGIDDPARWRSWFWFDVLARPFWWPLILAVYLPSMVGRTVVWAGITYRVEGPNRTRILNRA